MNCFDPEDDPELPDPSDMDQDDYTVMSRCPHCRKMIDEESEVCPRCGEFISTEDSPQKYPIWFALGVAVLIVAVFVAYVRLL